MVGFKISQGGYMILVQKHGWFPDFTGWLHDFITRTWLVSSLHMAGFHILQILNKNK